MDQRKKIHLDAKIKQDLNTNQGENRKLNAVLEKENTRSSPFFTLIVQRVFLANEKQGNFSKRKFVGSNHLLHQTKLKKTEN
jgi:hypothetical protein